MTAPLNEGIAFPPSATTIEDRFALLRRAKRLVILEQNRVRALLPETLRAEQGAELKAWEQGWFFPRIRRIAAVEIPLRAAMVEKYETDKDGPLDIVNAAADEASKDATLDKDIRIEEL